MFSHDQNVTALSIKGPPRLVLQNTRDFINPKKEYLALNH
jgi:hypothetical protein